MNEPWRREYPFESHFLPLAGARLHYLDESPTARRPESAGQKIADSGSAVAAVASAPLANHIGRSGDGPRPSPAETLLCVHGNPTWSFYWRHIAMQFRDRARVVVPDHIGCGLSEKPQRYEYRLAQHIANLRQLIETLDLRNITLLAHDWGGAIGLGAAAADPSRFARLILFNTAAFRSTRCPWRIRVCRTPVVGPWGVRGLNLFARAALTMATNKPERFTSEVCAGYLAPYDNYAHRVAVQRFVEDIPLSTTHPSYATLQAVEQGLARLADKPTLFCWGMRDWCFTPAFLDRFLEFFPRAEVERYADCGHYVVEDARERIGPRIETFLAAYPLASVEGRVTQ